MEENEARVEVTWKGEQSTLPDPVLRDSTDIDVKRWVVEAISSGSIPGMPADPNVDLTDFVVDRFQPHEGRPYHLISIRPKTPFGC